MSAHVLHNHPGKKARTIQMNKETKIQGKGWKQDGKTSKGSGHAAWRDWG